MLCYPFIYLFYIYVIYKYFKQTRKRILRRIADKEDRILDNLHYHIYDKKFAFKKYAYLIHYEFLNENLRENEIDVLKNDFTSVCKINNDETCIICYERLYDTEVTTLPFCNHKYHFGCLKTWSKQSSICPTDREYLRVLMIKHLHKDFIPEFEKN